MKLGAPTVALLVGARLVFTILQSWAILGTASIQTPVQVAGIVVTTISVTGYMAWQWQAARRAEKAATRERAAAAAAAGAELQAAATALP